ncbi:Kunitz-type serine protease [Dirofilaria immitis]
MTVINICLVDNQEISECMWITCHPPKVCQRINDIVSCISPNDATERKMEVFSKSMLSINPMNPITELILPKSSSMIPDPPSLLSSVFGTESFLPSEIMVKQEPLSGSAVKEDDLKMSEDSFTVKILPEICWLPAVTGPCSKVKILWYYNSLTHRCERFSFSGCGNANHFYSRKECEETCSVNEIFQ